MEKLSNQIDKILIHKHDKKLCRIELLDLFKNSFICLECGRKYINKHEKETWNTYKGMRSLYEKYTHARVLYKKTIFSEPMKILSIYKRNGYLTVNTEYASYPNMEKTHKDNIWKISGGRLVDELELLKL